MYGKIFESMYDGTLREDYKSMIVFMHMIILANEDGVVDMTMGALSGRTGTPIEYFEYGISRLESPDTKSRTPDQEGRRIERIDEHRDWGWRIVNYGYYRKLASREEKKRADRERIKKKRAKCSEESQGVANVAHTDTDTNTDSLSKDKQDESCHFSLKMKEHFGNTLAFCRKIEKMASQYHCVGKTFNPYQWVQEKVNKNFHPGAIAETLCSMEDGYIFSTIKVPYAYANKILATKNGNWNEKDAIAKHEDVKAEFVNFVAESKDFKNLIKGIG